MHAPSGYLDAVRSQEAARITVSLSSGTGIDETAWEDVTGISSEALPMSDAPVDQLSDKLYTMAEGLAVFEGDGIPTSGAVAPPISSQDATGAGMQVGLWSASISDASGAISWAFTVSLSASHTSALTVYSGEDIWIGAASAVFCLDGAQVASGQMTVDSERVYWPTAVTWDTVTVTVTELKTSGGSAAAYRHVRVAEVDFGAMVPVSSEYLMGEITWIQEADPLQQAVPLHELDYQVVNVDGDWDDDAGTTQVDTYKVGGRVSASIRVEMDSGTYILPMGAYVITEKTAETETVRFACFDLRDLLKSGMCPSALSTGTDLGTWASEVLGAFSIPHVVDSAVLGVYPSADADLSDLTAFEAAEAVQAAYDVWMVPQRDGYIRVAKGMPSEDYGTMPRAQEVEWPIPDNLEVCNYVSVPYDGGTATEDLRTSPDELRSTLQVSNDLLTADTASALASRLAEAVYTRAAVLRYVGDAACDVGDTMTYVTRAGNEVKGQVLRRTLTWNGLLEEEVRIATR